MVDFIADNFAEINKAMEEKRQQEGRQAIPFDQLLSAPAAPVHPLDGLALYCRMCQIDIPREAAKLTRRMLYCRCGEALRVRETR